MFSDQTRGASSGAYYDPQTILDTRDPTTHKPRSLEKLCVTPYFLTVLHLSAITNPPKTNNSDFSYSNFKIPFMLDLFNNTPLHYLLLRKEIDYASINNTFEYIVDYLEDTEQRTKNEVIAIIESLTPQFQFIITKINPKTRDRYLTLCCQPPISSTPLPRFGDLKTRKTFALQPEVDSQIQAELYRKGVDPVVFTSTLARLDYNPTSDDMFNLIKTLITIKSEEVFKSPIISKIIDHLWTQTKLVTVICGLSFSVLMLLFSIYIGFGKNIIALEAVITGLTVLFLITEMAQMYILRSSYFSDLWNFADVLQDFLMIVFMALRFSDDTNKGSANSNDDKVLAEEWISSLLILSGYLRWISYLRFFKPTSKLFASSSSAHSPTLSVLLSVYTL